MVRIPISVFLAQQFDEDAWIESFLSPDNYLSRVTFHYLVNYGHCESVDLHTDPCILLLHLQRQIYCHLHTGPHCLQVTAFLVQREENFVDSLQVDSGVLLARDEDLIVLERAHMEKGLLETL